MRQPGGTHFKGLRNSGVARRGRAVRRVFPSTASRPACQVAPARPTSRLSLLPACPLHRPVCLDPSPASATGGATWHCVQISPRLRVPLRERPLPLYPPGSLARGPAAHTPRLRCAGAPRRPARPSLLSLSRFPCVPSTLRRWVRGPVPLCWDRDARLPRATTESPPTKPVSASNPRPGMSFRRCIVRVMLRPACLPGPPDWLRREAATSAPTPPSEAPCHPRFSRRPSPAAAGSQARGANGKSPLVGTCTRPVRDR